jgi:hypothetical protein
MRPPKQKHTPWFRSVRGSYLPVGWQGLALYLLYVTYIVLVPLAWYLKGHSLWLLLTTVIPLLVAAAVVMQFIAGKHTK